MTCVRESCPRDPSNADETLRSSEVNGWLLATFAIANDERALHRPHDYNFALIMQSTVMTFLSAESISIVYFIVINALQGTSQPLTGSYESVGGPQNTGLSDHV
jgi:hypothetical protein